MLEITASIFSAKGRAASAAVCARRSFDAATICIALVIFCVALVEAMRTRMSFSDAMCSVLYVRHARACPGHPRLTFCPRQRRGWPGQSPAMTALCCKGFRVALDHALQLGG